MTVPVVFAAIVANPVLRLTSPAGERISLNLEASTIGIIDEAGEEIFLNALTTDLLKEKRDWYVVLRGMTPDSRVHGAVVIDRNGVSIIVNLPSGVSLRAPIQDSAHPKVSTSIAQEPVRPPFYVGELASGRPDGTIQPSLHLSQHPGGATDDGHSVRLSKHIWDVSRRKGQAIDPMNVLLYDDGWYIENILGERGWTAGVCGSDKSLYLYDERHGGEDSWELQDRHWGTDSGTCFVDRYHAREYLSETGDTHTPGFGSYRPLPVHWECWRHNLRCVDPQKGQDRLLADLRDHPNVGNIWFFHLDDNDDCKTCDRWNGWIDLYHITFSGEDPCGTEPTMAEFGGTVKTVAWFC